MSVVNQSEGNSGHRELESRHKLELRQEDDRQLEALAEELEKRLDVRSKSAKLALIGSVVSALFGGIAVFGGAYISQQPEPPPTTETTSVCVVAAQNVKKALVLGIRDPKLLDAMNSEDVDGQCGTEEEIAADIADGPR